MVKNCAKNPGKNIHTNRNIIEMKTKNSIEIIQSKKTLSLKTRKNKISKICDNNSLYFPKKSSYTKLIYKYETSSKRES